MSLRTNGEGNNKLQLVNQISLKMLVGVVTDIRIIKNSL